MSALRPQLLREYEIRRKRTHQSRMGVVKTVVVAQVLFWALAIGWYFGGAPVRLVEMVAAALFTFAVGAGFNWPTTRQRIEEGARLIANVREGRRRRRVVVYEDYLTIGEDIIVSGSVIAANVQGHGLCLEYEAATDGTKRERTFVGTERVLSRLDRALSALRGRSTTESTESG